MNNLNNSFKWATLLIALTFIAKITGGYLTNSLALISDAWHLLTDLISLILSWWAIKQSTLPPTPWATFGFHRVGILVALINNLSLIFISLYIFYAAYLRCLHPLPVEPTGMFFLAILGLLVSGAIVFLLNDGAKKI